MKGKRRHPTDEQLAALRAELEAVAARDGAIMVPPGARVGYVAVGCAPVGDGDGGME